MMIDVMIADDHPAVRDGIKQALKDDSSIKVVAEAHDGLELAAFLAQRSPPDVLLLDISMPHFEIFDAVPEFRQQHPDMKIIIVSGFGDKGMVRNMLDLGVDGYLVKDEQSETFPRAIHEVHDRRMFFSQSIMSFVACNETPPPKLSDRQKEMLILVAQDLTTSQIADKLGLTESSVNTHLQRAKEKLGVSTRVAALARAVKFGLVDISEIL
jgi:DNA-binding NarL/FixJ family response regulator